MCRSYFAVDLWGCVRFCLHSIRRTTNSTCSKRTRNLSCKPPPNCLLYGVWLDQNRPTSNVHRCRWEYFPILNRHEICPTRAVSQWSSQFRPKSVSHCLLRNSSIRWCYIDCHRLQDLQFFETIFFKYIKVELLVAIITDEAPMKN